MDYDGIRVLCPHTCGCSDFRPARGGFFQVQMHGCPGKCTMQRATELQGLTCADNLPDWDRWQLYVQGFEEYVKSVVGYEQNIWFVAKNYGGADDDTASIVTSFIAGDGFWNALKDFQFILPNPHPRNLTGCAFLASYEVVYLLGVDVCSTTGSFTSLIGNCPLSCGCMDHPDGDCPPSCHDFYMQRWFQSQTASPER